MSLISLMNKKVFVFDWDGTIFDSMSIKIETFSDVLSQMIGKKIKDADLRHKIKTMYQKLSGRPRKEIYENILDNFNLGRDLVDYEEFNTCLIQSNKKYLENAKIYLDAEILLKKLMDNKKIIFISSSVPRDELVFFATRKLRSDLLSGINSILGSYNGFTKGSEHFNFIQKNTDCNKDRMIFIGDDLADYQLSADAAVDFILLDRGNRFNYLDIFKINNLIEIGDMIS